MRFQPLIAAAVFCISGTAAAPADLAPSNLAPPAGLRRVPIDAATILRRHRAALGHPKVSTPETRVEQWSVSAEGLQGTDRYVRAGSDWRETQTLGPFTQEHGSNAGKRWSKNDNGIVLAVRGLHREDEVNRSAIEAGLRNGDGVRVLGETTVAPFAYVLEVDPQGGRKQWLFYEVGTYRLIRSEMAYEDRRIVETFDDFRTVDGITEAWHVHESDGRPENDVDQKLTQLQTGVEVAASEVAVPAARRLAGEIPAAGASVGVKIVDDRIFLPVELNGHTVYLQMDSGASGIVLDTNAARALGYKQYGSGTGATAGTYARSRTIVPEMKIGPVALHDVAVEVLPFRIRADEHANAIGLMGFDFFAQFVVHVDYPDQRVELLDSASFAAPSNARPLEAIYDDGVPAVAASIGKAHGRGFIVDTGADRSMIFSEFAKRNGPEIADRGLGDAMTATYPFVDHILGVGGEVQVRPVQVRDFAIAGYRFPQWLFYVSNRAPTFEVEDFDGLIGQDFLRNFDVYFDVAHEKVWFAPNARYVTRWG